MIPLVAALTIAVAADAGPDSDAGPSDAGPAGTRVEGQPCGIIAPSRCVPDLVCHEGTCRHDCGLYDDAGVPVGEQQDTCPPNRTCQTVTYPERADPLRAVCLPPQTQREGFCRAHLDPDACTDGMVCARTPDYDWGIIRYRCKVPCREGSDGGECPLFEECFRERSAAQRRMRADGGAELECSLDDDCPDGYRCVADGERHVCGTLLDLCGVPQRPVSLDDFANSLLFETRCNDAEDHLYCDETDFSEPGSARNECLLRGRLWYDDPDGLCVAACRVLSVDADADGIIAADEQGSSLPCPAGYRCHPGIGRRLWLGKGVPHPVIDYELAYCKTAECPPDVPCPAWCGPGETECVARLDVPFPYTGVCFGPTSTCAPNPPPDGGPAVEDAGSDGGEPIDAAIAPDVQLPVDAGEPTDSGSAPGAAVELDAGARILDRDAGPTTSADDCSCSGTESAPRAAPFGVIALLLLASFFRRRDSLRRLAARTRAHTYRPAGPPACSTRRRT